MKFNYKWALIVAPFVMMACSDDDLPTGNTGFAYTGDDVRFAVANNPGSRTMYQDQWDETTSQEIYWGNYLDGKDDFINIYCPENPERGFARYKINLQDGSPSNVAASVEKTSEIGVQWGEKGPHTFYAFYPADKAGTTLLDNKSTIRASVDNGQSPVVYKQKLNSADISTLTEVESFKTYINDNFNSSTNLAIGDPKTIYGMPDMEAAVMVAKKTMTAEEFGQDVPLQFNVLADVLDITLNGPIKPNSLGGNGIGGGERQFIQIQAATIEVVTPDASKKVEQYEIDQTIPIAGSFDLDMSAEVGKMVSNISGTSMVQLQLSINEENAVYYPTLFVRGESPATAEIDHLRLRAFLIPGQINGSNMNKLRVHLQTNYGDFYQMLDNDNNFVTGQIYPVKFGYFKVRGSDFDLTQWIGQLNPNIYISELSIPGAWHASNANYQGNVSMTQLYEAGIRAFEVHTKNGTDLKKAGDMTQDFDASTETETFEKPFVHTSITFAPNNNNNITTGSRVSNQTGWKINGTTYTYRRTVSKTAASVTKTTVVNVYTVPKFWIRLYRTTEDTKTPMSEAITNLHSSMKSSGLVFIELGMNDENDIDKVPYNSCTATTTVDTKNSSTAMSGYQYTNDKYNWNNSVYVWDSVDMTGATSGTPTTSTTYNGTFNLPGKEAWAIAVRSCFENLANSNVLYDGNLTANTTIADVKGKIIAKVNTNDSANEASYLWGDNCPALFSRWINGSANTPLTINLQWNSPVAPYDGGETGAPNTALHWCFTELDNIANGSSIDQRQKAIITMNGIAAANYADGLHRTFYESMIGGYINNSAEAANCQSVAKTMNTFALSRITAPDRQVTPLGLVFMNYAIAPSGEESSYNSATLIRAIINNNKAFLLNRKGDTSATPVEDNTNSYFKNNPQNPLK